MRFRHAPEKPQRCPPRLRLAGASLRAKPDCGALICARSKAMPQTGAAPRRKRDITRLSAETFHQRCAHPALDGVEGVLEPFRAVRACLPRVLTDIASMKGAIVL
jgi:hypothetical protein